MLFFRNFNRFFTVAEYIYRQPMAGSNIAGITEWLHADAKGKGMKSPLAIADSLMLLVDLALKGLKRLPPHSATSGNELQQTQSDIEALPRPVCIMLPKFKQLMPCLNLIKPTIQNTNKTVFYG